MKSSGYRSCYTEPVPKKDNSHDRLYRLTGVARQLVSCHGRYHQYFQRNTVNIEDKAFQYLKGLFQADKKNLERIEERVPETKYDPLQYFLSDADWDWHPINDQIAVDADKLLGGHGDSALYIDETGIPKKGKKPTKLKAQTASIRVDKLVKDQTDDAWKRIKVRETTKGKLIVDILHKTVWLWDEKEEEARLWHLVVRREVDSPNEIKYSLSNADPETSVKRLAYMQAQRYWVERPFQDAKNECGMGDYQSRGGLAWYHHMTMVMMAMLFMIEQRLHYQFEIPLLSCADITTLLKSILPRRDVTEDEILRQLEKRHKKRQASIDYARKKQEDSGVLQHSN